MTMVEDTQTVAEGADSAADAQMFAPVVPVADVQVEFLSDQIKELGDVILELDLRGTEDEGACGVAALRLRELTAANAEMAAKLEAAEKARIAGEKAAKVAPSPKVRKARKVGDVPGFDAGDLIAALHGDADDDGNLPAFTVVPYRDGKELTSVPGIIVSGLAWQRGRRGVELIQHVTVKTGEGAVSIDGFALFDASDTLLAKAPQPDTVLIPPLATMEFRKLAFA
jgi:hypothetical protein